MFCEIEPAVDQSDRHSLPSLLEQAIDSIHQVGLYCLALVPANTLPKTPLGGIHISDTKQFFLEGNLHPCNILMCPHTCVTNLPKPRQKQPGKCVCVLLFFFVLGTQMSDRAPITGADRNDRKP